MLPEKKRDMDSVNENAKTNPFGTASLFSKLLFW